MGYEHHLLSGMHPQEVYFFPFTHQQCEQLSTSATTRGETGALFQFFKTFWLPVMDEFPLQTGDFPILNLEMNMPKFHDVSGFIVICPRLQPALGPCPNIRWDDATLILWTLRGQSAGINPTPYIDPKGTYINPRKTQSKVYIMEYMWSVARVPHLHSIRVSTIDQVPVWHARLQFRRNATSLGHDASGMWFRAKHWVFSGKHWMDT